MKKCLMLLFLSLFALTVFAQSAWAEDFNFPGLSGTVTVTEDQYGIPTIKGDAELDVVFVQGYLHARDRFFQMDLMRRDAAGELSALVGRAALQRDRKRRVHRLRAIARQVVSRVTGQERAILAAYTEGVNAGLRALSVRPFEYLLLRGEPVPWRPEDTILCIFAMYFQLNDEDALRDRAVGQLHDVLPPALFRFLTVTGTPWDAPMVGVHVVARSVVESHVDSHDPADHDPVGEATVSNVISYSTAAPVGSSGVSTITSTFSAVVDSIQTVLMWEPF